MLKSVSTCLLGLCFLNLFSQSHWTVASDGSGDFKSIQQAIENLPDDKQEKTIFIKPGVYREKIYLEKNNVKLIGLKKPAKGLWWKDVKSHQSPNPDAVYILISEARDIWRCDHNDDWGSAAVNIRANDITLENLVVANTFGFDLKEDTEFVCKGETKKVRKDGHQFALRSMPPCQRLTVKHCNFYCLGGDTVSPWDVENGTYYFEGCTMEGGVDFYCPRGWAVADNCTFICHNKNAAVWHDGTGNEDAKSVIRNGSFVGETGYKLGRYHRDAQIYLINCSFSKEMADADIYQVPTKNQLAWDRRIYYRGNKKKGNQYTWYANNISKTSAKGLTKENVLSERWNNPKSYKIYERKEEIINQSSDSTKVDMAAEHMLMAQRVSGGWPKTLDGKTQPPNYKDFWSAQWASTVLDDKTKKDATIDNNATTRELTYLLKTYRETSNKRYLEAIINGLKFLVEMQYADGGFPQFYPDTSGYRRQITYNDDAMIKALLVFREFSSKENMDLPLGQDLRDAINNGSKLGVQCILKTQLSYDGEKSIWAAQYDNHTYLPAKARAYEHPSYATKESVAIIEYLMGEEQISPEIIQAVRSGIKFLDRLRLPGMKVDRVKDESQESGLELAITQDPSLKSMWARFYSLDDLQPIFSGRDGIIKHDIFEIENERRVHYGWYGYWPEDLLDKEFSRWHESHIGRSEGGVTNEPDTTYTLDIAFKGVIKKYKDITYPVIKSDKVQVEKDLVYSLVGARELHMDVVSPVEGVGARIPVLMIHGGGWRSGSKDMHLDLAKALAERGNVVFLVEYRLSTEALYPAPIEDLRSALRFMVKQQKHFNLDTSNLVVMGFSAGGQLASLLATSIKDKKFGGLNVSNKGLPNVKAFVDLDGVTAFIHPDSSEGKDTKKTSAASYWFGAPAWERPDLYHDASALDRLKKNLPMALFIASGEKRMQAGWKEYREILDKAGVYNDFLKFDGAPHNFVYFEPWFSPMVQKIDTFLHEIKNK